MVDLARQLEERDAEIARLRSLVESFAQVNSSLVLDTVLENTLRRATELTGAAIGSIALVDEARTHLQFVQSTDLEREKLKEMRIPLDQGIAAHVVRTGKPVRVEDCYRDSRFYGGVDANLGSRTRTYLCVPLVADAVVIGTTQIMNRVDGGLFTEKDEELLVGFSQQAALAIKNAQRHELMLKQKAIDSEFRLCAQIQTNFFPREVPRVEGYSIHGASVPCREVGGDYYSFVSLPGGALEAVQADVSGKGMAAALTVSEIHCAVHLLAESGRSLVERVGALNQHLGRSLVAGRFVTFLALRLLPATGDLEAVVAGHVPPRIVGRDGSVRTIARTRPVLGPGVLQRRKVESRTDRLGPGEVLVAFTDGYSEAEDPEGNLLGEDPVAEVVREHRELELPAIHGRLDERVRAFQRGMPPSDDMTILLLRRELQGREPQGR